MGTTTDEINIAASPSAVFELLLGPPATEWIKALQSAQELEDGRYAYEYREGGSRPYVVAVTIAELVRPKRLVLETFAGEPGKPGFSSTITFELARIGKGKCALTYTEDKRHRGKLSRAFGSLTDRFAQRTLRKDLDALAELAESGS